MNVLISVVVPVYNVKQYLEKCICSIMKQTYKNIEIILVDDGSTDGSGTICDEYAKKYDYILAVHKKNGGLADARNYGIEHCNGEYICFIDSDDFITENMIEVLYNNLINNNADVSICNYKIYDAISDQYADACDVREGLWTIQDFWENCYSDKLLYCTYSWNKMYKKSIFDKARFSVGRISEDAWILKDIISNCKQIYVSNERCYIYVQRSGSIMQTSLLKSWLSAVEACIERMSYFEEEKDYINLNKNMAYIIRTMVNSKINAAFTEVSDLYKKDKYNVKNVYKKYRKLLSSKTRLQYMIFMISEKLYGKLMKA